MARLGELLPTLPGGVGRAADGGGPAAGGEQARGGAGGPPPTPGDERAGAPPGPSTSPPKPNGQIAPNSFQPPSAKVKFSEVSDPNVWPWRVRPVVGPGFVDEYVPMSEAEIREGIDRVAGVPDIARGALCPRCGRLVPLVVITEGALAGKVIPGTCECVQREWAAEEAARADEGRRRRVEGLFGRSRLGARFAEATFARWEARPGTAAAFRAVRAYADGWPPADGRGLIVFGPVGVGKSHLAAAVVNELLGREVAAVFQNVPELLGRFRATYSKGADEKESDLLQGLEEADLVVLDDLGAEKVTEWTEAMLYRIIDARYRAKRPVVVTTNLRLFGAGSLEEAIGTRAMDRLVEVCDLVGLKGESYRRRRATEKTRKE